MLPKGKFYLITYLTFIVLSENVIPLLLDVKLENIILYYYPLLLFIQFHFFKYFNFTNVLVIHLFFSCGYCVF